MKKQKRGRPSTRWKDDIVAAASKRWTDMAKDGQKWSFQREAFAQSWEKDS